MIERRKTRQVKVGDVKVGGNAPIPIQSMTKTDTRDVAATVRQIKELEKAGCDIIRAAVLDTEAARAIKGIKKKIDIPLAADIHFHYKLAIEAINSGADKIRLNPGNIKKKEDIAEVVKLAKKKRVPIRIGVNSGSLPVVVGHCEESRFIGTTKQSPKEIASRPLASLGAARNDGGCMVKVALNYIKLFESLDFRDIIVSLKASDVPTTIDAYREMAKVCDYPFHLGVTAAGSSECGIIKSSIGIGTLLAEGIGDTVRVSLTGEPQDEIRVAKEILGSLGLRKFGIDIIACPTCGRCEVDLIKIVDDLTKRLSTVNCQLSTRPLKVAVMGCVVNGPGESMDADIGLAAGKGCGILFKRGKQIRKVAEADFVKVLLQEVANVSLRGPRA